jgi:hypothetical protein
MSAMMLLVAEGVLGAGCVVLAWTPARQAAASRSRARSLMRALAALPEDERIVTLARLAGALRWEGRLAADVLAASDERAKIAAVNDALAEVEHALHVGEAWPAASLRIALFGTTLLGIVAYLGARALLLALAIVGVGASAALACVEAGRALRRHAAAERQAVDALIAVAFGSLAAAPLEMPEHRAHRRAGRHAGRPLRGRRR